MKPLGERYLDRSLELIEEVGRFSPHGDRESLPLGLLELLKRYRRQHRFLLLERGDRLGGYNHITKRIVLNQNKLLFLSHDFDQQRARLPREGRDLRLPQIEAKERRCLFELSGVLIHEGQHAFQPIYSWNPLRFRSCRKEDEENAFRAEQLWYWMLYQSFAHDHGRDIEELARNAAYDAASSRAYRHLGLRAPSLIG